MSTYPIVKRTGSDHVRQRHTSFREIVLLLLLVLAAAVDASAQQFVDFRTLAGQSPAGASNGTGTEARFNGPTGIAVDSVGNLYVADAFNCWIRKITPANVVTGFAGNDFCANGSGNLAYFFNPQGIAIDSLGTLYVADTSNHAIRKITPAGVVSTLAGQAGSSGSADGTGSAARFNNPRGIAVDSAGNVYVGDSNNNAIRQITPVGVVTTLAGQPGMSGSTDGTGNAARFNQPRGVAVDNAGVVYVADSNNHTIRKITAGGVVTTLAGTAGMFGNVNGTGSAARFNGPRGVAVDSAGTLFVADTNTATIRQVTAAGVVTTLAGSGILGGADGTGTAAQFNFPEGVAIDAAGTVYVADTTNDTIRKIAPGAVVTTLAGFVGSFGSADGVEASARFALPFGVGVGPHRTVYVADRNNNTIRKISAAGEVTTFAGLAGVAGSTDGPGNSARFSAPRAVAVDSAGTVFVAEIQHTIRAITPAGVVSTLAGLAGSAGSTDGTGSVARFNQPSGIAVDNAGTIYVADAGNHTIRTIAPGGVVTTLAGLAGTSGSTDGTGSAARFNLPRAVAVDASGNVYVADTNNHTIRRITPAGVVTTIAGLAGSGGFLDGIGSAARFQGPQGIGVDETGTVYVADGSNTIRRITGGNVVAGIAGCPGCIGSEYNGRFNALVNLAVDSQNYVYVADSRNNTIRTNAPLSMSLVVNFGSYGIWMRRGTTWRQVHPYAAKTLMSLQEDRFFDGLIVDFGPGVGVWFYGRDFTGEEFWFQVHTQSPRALAGLDLDGDGEVETGVLDFTGYGLWLFDSDNEQWSPLHGSSTSHLLAANLDGVGGDELIVDFPGYGLWAWSAGSWAPLHPADVTSMIKADLNGDGKDDLVVNFPGYGVWGYTNGSWSQIHPYAATQLADADLDGNGVSDLVVNFAGGLGVWVWQNGTTWRSLHPSTPDSIVSGDLDTNGLDEVIMSFGTYGLWSYEDGRGWAQVHPSSSSVMAIGRMR